MIPCQRHLFDIPRDIAYFNTAYVAPSPKSVREAGERGVARKSSPWTIGTPDFYGPSESIRGLFARIIGATANDIALVPATSYGLAVAARNLTLRVKQRIVLLENQYPNNVLPWLALADATGAEIATVRCPQDEDWTRAVLEEIDERAGLVTLPQCHWMDGRLIDLVRIGERCRDVGVPLVVDITQSAGAYPFDVKAVKPDFLVAAGYKWLLCPYSFAFLYVAPHRQDGTPIEVHSNNRRDSDKGHVWKDGVLQYREGWLPGARRFDVGERANFALSPMAEAALRQILEWGPDRINRSIRQITERIIATAEPLGYSAPRADARSGHFTGLKPPRPLPRDAQERLARLGVYLTVRGDFLRISPHIWVDDSDLDRLTAGLDNLAKQA